MLPLGSLLSVSELIIGSAIDCWHHNTCQKLDAYGCAGIAWESRGMLVNETRSHQVELFVCD